MQVEKAHIRAKILEVTRHLFFTKGYSAVTMREIALLSGIGLGSIYTYYPSKESLLKEILNPFLANMKKRMDEHFVLDKNYYNPKLFASQKGLEKSFEMVLDIIRDYRKEFLFLFTYGHQTPYRNYFRELIESYYQKSVSFMEGVSEIDRSLNTNVSRGFLYLMNEIWFSALKIYACNKEMTEEERHQFVAEYVAYCTAGWHTILLGKRIPQCQLKKI